MHPKWTTHFLNELTATGNVSGAVRVAGTNTTTVYALRKTDADFAAAWEQALEDSADVLEAEARRRAVQGVQEPVVYQGQLTPVWARDANGAVLMEEYEAGTDPKSGNPMLAQRPVQELDANGRPVWLTITKHSDALLALLLKGRRKRIFADRTELTGADGGALDVKVMDRTAKAARVAALMAVAAKRKSDADEFGDLA